MNLISNKLISYVQGFLIEHQAEYLQYIKIQLVFLKHETFTDLHNFCLEKICEEPEILLNSDKFINLEAPLLELLLKRDDLFIDEIEIWESLLKWCFAQQNVKNNPAEWSKDDIANVEKSLHRFIPLIRFMKLNIKISFTGFINSRTSYHKI